MKPVLFLLLLFSFLINFHGQTQTLTVIVQNVKSDQGQVRVAIYHSEKEYMKTLWQGKSVKAKSGEVELVFGQIPPGDYAISVFHDANENGKLDSNLVGIPKEGFGFSNNAMGNFGPPSFNEARFLFDGQQRIEIALRYR